MSALAAGLPDKALVYSSTSHTQASESILTVDAEKARKQRLRQSVLTTARLMQADIDADPSERYQLFMATATYQPDLDWQPKHISACIKTIKQWCRRQGGALRYMWVFELNKAGRPHYHLLLWLPERLRISKTDWRHWWPHGITHNQKVKSPQKAVVYLAKGTDGKIPKGARLNGSGGLSSKARTERAWCSLPAYVRQWCPDKTRCIRRAKGGGWVIPETAEFLPAQYEVIQRWPLMLKKRNGESEAHRSIQGNKSQQRTIQAPSHLKVNVLQIRILLIPTANPG